jgi:hypothetical protein
MSSAAPAADAASDLAPALNALVAELQALRKDRAARDEACTAARAAAATGPSLSAIEVPGTDGADSPPTKLSACAAMLDGILKRFKNSPLVHLFDVEPENPVLVAAHADVAVSTFALVSTLLLSCPYALFGSLQTSSWDAYRASLLTCSANPFTGAKPWGPTDVDAYVSTLVVPYIAGAAMSAVYLALTTILLVVVYFTMRPQVLFSGGNDSVGLDYFKKWWLRGRFLVLSIFLCMMGTVIAVLTFSNTYYTNFFTSTADICVAYNSRYHTYIGATTAIATVIIAAFFLAM